MPAGWAPLVAAVGAGLISTARAQEPTGFLNRAIAVDGLTHRYQLYVPPSAQPLAGDPLPARLRPAGHRLAAPDLDRAGRGDPASPGALATLDRALRELSTGPDRVHLVGLSAGRNGVWNLADRSPERCAARVAVSGVLPA